MDETLEGKLRTIRSSVDARIGTARAEQQPLSEVNWLQGALARTEDYYLHGPRGPASWVLVAGKEIPAGAFVAGDDDGLPLYAARGYLQALFVSKLIQDFTLPTGTLAPSYQEVGKAGSHLPKGATLGYGWDLYDVDVYEVLVVCPTDVTWVPVFGQLNLAALGARPIEGGYEEPAGEPLYVCQAYIAGAWRPGKHSAGLGGAFIPYAGREVLVAAALAVVQPGQREKSAAHLESLIDSHNYSKLATLVGQDAQGALDLLWNRVLELSKQGNTLAKSDALRQLVRMSVTYDMLPSELLLSGIQIKDTIDKYSGALMDTQEGLLGNHRVALKRLRVYLMFSGAPKLSLKQEFHREALVWKTLSHEYVLPLLGLAQGIFEHTLCMVLPWAEGGTVLQHIRALRSKGQMLGEAYPKQVYIWLQQVASALAYLHKEDVVHGNLRANNVLINAEGVVQLSDFGQTPITDMLQKYYATMPANTLRYQSPELLDPEMFGLEASTPSYTSDVYAFGHVCREICTLEEPFTGQVEYKIISQIVKGERPPRPSFPDDIPISDSLWRLMSQCWKHEPASRPTAVDVSGQMDHLVKELDAPPPRLVTKATRRGSSPSTKRLPPVPLKESGATHQPTTEPRTTGQAAQGSQSSPQPPPTPEPSTTAPGKPPPRRQDSSSSTFRLESLYFWRWFRKVHLHQSKN
ncbi:hypothetical protein EIP91_003769 [Steccherinum ochraceum]|uniref:Protein kinase domain-containing protein n=1 Tax=Steccherinum ochraceum TaxID=92696 RepID=A0A4R0RGA3_9APHY|nr:hypothetical protein EIP91_003769 [Steccherinum ochraceum]